MLSKRLDSFRISLVFSLATKKRREGGMKEGGQPAPAPGAAHPKPFPAS